MHKHLSNKTSMVLLVLAAAAAIIMVAFLPLRSDDSGARAARASDAPGPQKTFLPIVTQDVSNLVRLQARGARLLSSDFSSWDKALKGNTIFYWAEPEMFDVMLMIAEYTPPTPPWFALARTYLEFDISSIQDKGRITRLQLSLPLCATQDPNGAVGVTAHRGTWLAGAEIISDTFAASWNAWDKQVGGENQASPVVGENFVVPLSLDLLQADDGVIRLVLRASGEEGFGGGTQQTCFDGEKIYLELWQ
jgi:hypothetical protein